MIPLRRVAPPSTSLRVQYDATSASHVKELFEFKLGAIKEVRGKKQHLRRTPDAETYVHFYIILINVLPAATVTTGARCNHKPTVACQTSEPIARPHHKTQGGVHRSFCSHPAGVVDLIGLPAVLAAEIFAIMRAVRVLLMYYPSKRKAWGRIPKEKPIFKTVVWAYALMEIVVWSAAAVYGVPR